jgi:hypothetical protein
MRQLYILFVLFFTFQVSLSAQDRYFPEFSALYPKETFEKFQWKPLAGMNVFFTQKQQELDDMLRIQGIQDQDKAFFLCQKQFYGNLAVNMAMGILPLDAINQAFEKVHNDFALQPETKLLPVAEFPSILNEVIEQLQAVPVPQQFYID